MLSLFLGESRITRKVGNSIDHGHEEFMHPENCYGFYIIT